MHPILSLKLGVTIPLGYRYVTEGYTLNAYENPRYQNAGQGAQGVLQGSQNFG
jgi:hypothetical protein